MSIPTKQEMLEVSERFDNDLRIYPEQFVRTCAKYKIVVKTKVVFDRTFQVHA